MANQPDNRRIVVFGNSGSGKSTLARRLADANQLAHLDLDTIAWNPGTPPVRAQLKNSLQKINAFTAANAGWVVEGCYADLLKGALISASEIVFLDVGLAQCEQNAKNRSFEPHKYATREAQDANLPMLLEWIGAYYTRDDEFSYAAQCALYESSSGKKTRPVNNQEGSLYQ